MHSGQKGGTDTHNAIMAITSDAYWGEKYYSEKTPKYYNKTVCVTTYKVFILLLQKKKLQHHSVFLRINRIA